MRERGTFARNDSARWAGRGSREGRSGQLCPSRRLCHSLAVAGTNKGMLGKGMTTIPRVGAGRIVAWLPVIVIPVKRCQFSVLVTHRKEEMEEPLARQTEQKLVSGGERKGVGALSPPRSHYRRGGCGEKGVRFRHAESKMQVDRHHCGDWTRGRDRWETLILTNIIKELYFKFYFWLW